MSIYGDMSQQIDKLEEQLRKLKAEKREVWKALSKHCSFNLRFNPDRKYPCYYACKCSMASCPLLRKAVKR